MDLLLLSPEKSSQKDQYQPAPAGSSNGIPCRLSSDLQLSSFASSNAAFGWFDWTGTGPLLDGLTGDGVEITKDNTTCASQLEAESSVGKDSGLPDSSGDEFVEAQPKPGIKSGKGSAAYISKPLPPIYGRQLTKPKKVATVLPLNKQYDNRISSGAAKGRTSKYPSGGETLVEDMKMNLDEPRGKGMMARHLNRVDSVGENKNEAYQPRLTTKPIKVAATTNQMDKDSAASLDSLPENFTLPVARKVRASKFSRQQIECQIARGKELLQRRDAVQLSCSNRLRPHKRSAGQMLSSIPSDLEGEMSVENIIDITEPVKKRQKTMEKIAKSSAAKRQISDSQSERRLPSKSECIQKEQVPGASVMFVGLKWDIGTFDNVSDIDKFKSLHRKYVELRKLLKKPADLALKLINALEYTKKSGTKKEVSIIKKKIAALEKRLKRESFQIQKREFMRLENQLESMKLKISCQH
ncbi:unnamed protein product [Hermetia illucens]|uniref:Uncharacterized protein n=1 Tax=Hermetia illucens TaxID=343691 RepID=A0A7R8UZU2_HERIL|nr:unnamed protein product [Hermetia illucens]